LMMGHFESDNTPENQCLKLNVKWW
jgi:hypothetical protein